MLNSNNKYVLQKISESKKPIHSRVDLLHIRKINFGIQSFISYKSIKKQVKDHDLCISLLQHERTSLLDLIFDDEQQMQMFVTGLQIMIKQA